MGLLAFLVGFLEKEKPSSALWECGKRGAFSEGGGQRWETGAWRPSRKRWRFSMAVHRPAFPQRSGSPSSDTLGTGLGDASQKVTLGSLHAQSGFGVGLLLRSFFQAAERYTRAKATGAFGNLLE